MNYYLDRVGPLVAGLFRKPWLILLILLLLAPVSCISRAVANDVPASIAAAAALGDPTQLDSPVAVDDELAVSELRASINVTANDTHDETVTVRIEDVRLVSAVPHADYDCLTPSFTPTITSTPVGRISVDFGIDVEADRCSREVTVAYTLVDSLGQRSSPGAFKAIQHRAVDDFRTVDNDVNSEITDTPGFLFNSAPGENVRFNVGRNDVYAASAKNTRWSFKVVDQPEFGTVNPEYDGWVRYVLDNQARPARSDSFTYRLCEDISGQCSNTSTVAIKFAKTGQPPQSGYSAGTSAVFHSGSSRAPRVTDISDYLAAQLKIDPSITAGWNYALPTGVYQHGSYSLNGDRLAYTLSSFPTGLAPASDVIQIWITDPDTGAMPQVGSLTVQSFTFAASFVTLEDVLAEGAGPDVANDRMWVSRNARTALRPFVNDKKPLPRGYNNALVDAYHDGRLVGPVSDEFKASATGVATLTKAPTLGTIAESSAQMSNPLAEIDYISGSREGVDEVRFRHCDRYPDAAVAARLECVSQTLNIYVAPNAAARNDNAKSVRGTSVNVEVLENDTYTDTDVIPARVVLGSLPEGVNATVDDNRTISVTANESYTPDSVVLDYQLTDFTGTSTAAVEVDLSVDTPVDPPVEPTPDPEPTPDDPAPEDPTDEPDPDIGDPTSQETDDPSNPVDESTPSLPHTGGPALAVGIAGVVLLVAGAGVIVAARRRRVQP